MARMVAGEWAVEVITLDGQAVFSVKLAGQTVGNYASTRRAGIFTRPEDVERVMGRANYARLEESK